MAKKFLIFLAIVIAIPVFIFFFRVGYMVVNECEDVPCYPYLDEAKERAQQAFNNLCSKENLDCSDVKISASGHVDRCWIIFFSTGEYEAHEQFGYYVCPDHALELLNAEERIPAWPRKQQPKVDK